MKIWMEAIVEWVHFANGGRQKHLPNNTRYCPIIVFPDAPTEDSWSAEILTKSINDNNESTIDISFLVQEAPFELLIPGAKFELHEGKKCVATGVVVKKINR